MVKMEEEGREKNPRVRYATRGMSSIGTAKANWGFLLFARYFLRVGFFWNVGKNMWTRSGTRVASNRPTF